MAYTFSFLLSDEYSYPSAHTTNFSFEVVPTLRVRCTSSVSGVAAALVGSTASIPAVGACSFSGQSVAQSEWACVGTTDVVFKNSYMTLSIAASASVSFGGIAITGSAVSVLAESTAYFERYYPPPIQGVTTFTPVGGGVTPVYFYARGKSEGTFSASFEKQTRAVVFGRAILSVKTNVIRPLLFSANAGASPVFVGRSIFQSLAAIQGVASLESAFGAVQDTQTEIQSSSVTNFFVDRIGAGTANLSGVAAVHADGAYTTITVTPYSHEDDTVFVTSKRQEVFVHVV